MIFVTLPASIRRYARLGMRFGPRLVTRAGIVQSEARIATDSQKYWRSSDSPRWASDSHWRSAPPFDGNDLWNQIGQRHLTMLESVMGVSPCGEDWGRVVEWGCGGGANAVRIAPRCREFIGVDVASESLDECRRQVEAECQTPFRPILVDVAEPERALTAIDGPCDAFVSFYVFELLPTPEYGQRILEIAAQLLVPGGNALVQIKYDDGTWRTRARRRNYRFGISDMTTYPIAQFWDLASACGLKPQSVWLRPRDELDERYAYFHLHKAHDSSRAKLAGPTVLDRLRSIGLSEKLIADGLSSGRVQVDGVTVTDPLVPAAPPAWIVVKDL